MEDGIFYGIWSILRPFGILCCHLVYFPRLGMLHQEKSGNTGTQHRTPFFQDPMFGFKKYFRRKIAVFLFKILPVFAKFGP
jgi:hypothetical protein